MGDLEQRTATAVTNIYHRNGAGGAGVRGEAYQADVARRLSYNPANNDRIVTYAKIITNR